MGMRLGLWVLLAAAAWSAGGCGQPTVLLNRDELTGLRRVAVLEFSGMTAEGARPGDALANAVVKWIGLDLPGRLEVKERSQVEKVLDEWKAQEAGLTDGGVQKLGRQLGVDAVVLGDTLQYSKDKVYKRGVIGGRFVPFYNVGAGMRIVSVSDARVVYSCTAESLGQSSLTDAADDVARQLLAPLVIGLNGGRR